MSETVKREEEVLKYWKENNIFEKSLQKPSPKGEFVFYDGPPFATGLPHTGSLLSSVIKDVVPRYKTMQGYRVPRVWGWDCHGLPIESLVEKELGLKTKKDILNIGIAAFNEKARSMVLKYVHDWEKYVDRVGRWVDFKNSYKTMDNSYIESVWWGLKELHKKNLLYEGRRVLMYCPHCETPLAKAEIAMDNTYKDITEEAVTVRFKVKNPKKHNLPEGTALLAWTTTPWTLPGNVGLAVGKDIEYGVESGVVRAKEGGGIKGKDLVGAEYEPLYDVPALKSKTSCRVYAADFVSTEEGTGIVHTAVMYGEDDFALGQKEKLPMVQLLEPNGHYNSSAPEFIRGEYIKKAEKAIKADLEERGLLFEKKAHTHSYPHCYRCGTPLIYNAVPSWFINIQKVKQKMLAENEKVTWVPEHLKHGRFKNIVENAPDWTISRNRFWASPLPVWKEKDGDGLLVVGSLDELLSKTKRSGNRYFVMRHGEALNLTEHVLDGGHGKPRPLTEKGRGQVIASAQELKKENIDLIVASPLPRTHETATLVQKELGLPDQALMTDGRLREMQFGELEGKTIEEWHNFYSDNRETFTKRPAGGETYADIRKRAGELLFEIERRYTGKNILLVTHDGTAWLLDAIAHRRSNTDIERQAQETSFRTAEWRELPFVPFPHNADYELDLHRPYIDEVKLVEGGRTYLRVSEVLDCWVESGSMPFASMGYPHDTSRVNPRRFFGLFPKGYPGDFIAEYIAQTRTWFYYMHAMGVLLFGQRAFKTVVSTGTILAADGSKMSKSKGNYTDPYELMDKWGADALRFHLMGSVVMQSEDLNFRDDDVREAHNRLIGILWNSYKFFELYKDELDPGIEAKNSPHVLDRWMRARLSAATFAVTAALDAYDLPRAARELRAVVEDYSTWYLRRSRDRIKDAGEDKQYALANQRETLRVIAQLLAPLTPFVAESVYRGIELGESVHLSDWPAAGEADAQLLKEMEAVRALASKGLELRERAGIKVRQPLAALETATPVREELQPILLDELNIKELRYNAEAKETTLDTTITPELKEEGQLREWVRAIQGWRKEQGLAITDRPGLMITTSEADFVRKHREALRDATGLLSLETKEGEGAPVFEKL